MKYNAAHTFDELDVCQVHVVLRVLIDQFVIVDRLRFDVLMTLMSIM